MQNIPVKRNAKTNKQLPKPIDNKQIHKTKMKPIKNNGNLQRTYTNIENRTIENQHMQYKNKVNPIKKTQEPK